MSASLSFPWLGSYIPDVPTPFDNSDRIDVGALAKLCEQQIAAGTAAMVVCGTAGEASALCPIEQEVIVRTAVDVACRRARVIAGTCSNSTELSVKLGQRAEAAGADAILSVVPY